MAPGFEGKAPGHGTGALKPGTESGPTKRDAKVEMPSKVSNRIADLDQRVDMDPMRNSKFLPSRRASAKRVALGRRSPGPQGVQVAEGKSIGTPKSCSVIGPAG